MTQWKKHSAYNLLISDDGQVKGNRSIRKPRLDYDGYQRINITQNKKTVTLSVHRLVADCFLPKRNNKLQINHINGKKCDNRVENLEIVTAAENTTKAFRAGLVSTCHPVMGYYSKREAERALGISRRRL